MTMTAEGFDFMHREEHKLRLGRNLGDALAEAVRQHWPRDTAKHIERRWDIDPATAKNVVRGKASERTVTKAIQSEGWTLLTVLGEALTGETYEQHLQTLIAEADDARRKVEARREHVARLERIAAGADRLDAGEGGFSRLQRDSGTRSGRDGVGSEEGADPQVDRRSGERRRA